MLRKMMILIMQKYSKFIKISHIQEILVCVCVCVCVCIHTYI